MDLPSRLIAVLFTQAEPRPRAWLTTKLAISATELADALPVAQSRLQEAGLNLLDTGEDLALGTTPEAASLIESLLAAERNGDLSQAALETLTIVLYLGPISRAKIEYWRGVNSAFTLRLLALRGLIERSPDPNDSRSYLYRPTVDALAKLGVGEVCALPEYNSIRQEIAKICPSENESVESQN